MTVITARGPTVVTRDQYNRGRLSCSVCIQWRSQDLEGGHGLGDGSLQHIADIWSPNYCVLNQTALAAGHEVVLRVCLQSCHL